MMKMVRAAPRSRKLEAKTTAAQMPISMGAMTEAVVKYNVRATAHRKRGSSNRCPKLPHPTKYTFPDTFQLFTDITRVNSQGNRITATTTTAAGMANSQY